MQPTAEEVRAQLERLLASEALASSTRLLRFLRHVVERTLEGEGGRLKEYTVGVEVFDRGDQYDPRIDSIVRVEAGRLRAKLVEYYNGPGAADEVIVRLPRGGYVPAFERRAPPRQVPKLATAPGLFPRRPVPDGAPPWSLQPRPPACCWRLRRGRSELIELVPNQLWTHSGRSRSQCCRSLSTRPIRPTSCLLLASPTA